MTATMQRRFDLYADHERRDRYRGQSPPVVAMPRANAELVHFRRVNGAVQALIRESGLLRLLTFARFDSPGLELLSASDRASVQGLIAVIQRDGGQTDAI